MELRELAPGLHRWTAPHPEWKPGADWEQDVGCVAAGTADALVLVDPLVPDDGWDTLDALVERSGRPVASLVTVEWWHERSAAAVADRYGAAVWTPASATPVPGAVEAELVLAPDWKEALVVLPEHRTLVTGDLIAGDGAGGLRATVEWVDEDQRPWVVPALCAALARILERPLELVLPSHGDPVVADAAVALERALGGLSRPS